MSARMRHSEVSILAVSGSQGARLRGPSGTEPKIKLYIFAKGADAAEADAALDAIEESGRKLLA